MGGHDHHYTHSVESDVTILKSGSEFREFSTIDVQFSATGRPSFDIKQHRLSLDVEPDAKMEQIVDDYTLKLREASQGSAMSRFRFNNYSRIQKIV